MKGIFCPLIISKIMVLFLLGLLLLFLGYFTYGRLVEKILSPDDRQTPAIANYDGVDYVCLPHWKNMLIQLLNIAGIGPIIGVILGVKFGAIVFLIIPVGNIIAGATHDFIGGMMSMRSNGANLPVLIRDNLGSKYAGFFSVFMMLLLMLVVAVFINIPAKLISGLCGSDAFFWPSVGVIFAYYICATLFPIDKIVGKIYPFFGALLVVSSIAMFGAIFWYGFKDPSLLSESIAFKERMWTAENGHPIVPLLFVTIACGIISGFHATQSPIIARTMRSERQARSSFYGMMVVEGVIAMVWAAAGLAIYNVFPEKMSVNPALVLSDITTYFLGTWVGGITVLGVVVLAITSGDTAMRSMRLSGAEMLKISQKPISNRLWVCAPLIICVLCLLVWSNSDAKTFANLWNYFAWANQVLAASTLMAAVVWLLKRDLNGMIALVPGMFMTFIVLTYILWISPKHGGPAGFGLDINISYAISAALTLLLAVWVWRRGKKRIGSGHK